MLPSRSTATNSAPFPAVCRGSPHGNRMNALTQPVWASPIRIPAVCMGEHLGGGSRSTERQHGKRQRDRTSESSRRSHRHTPYFSVGLDYTFAPALSLIGGREKGRLFFF